MPNSFTTESHGDSVHSQVSYRLQADPIVSNLEMISSYRQLISCKLHIERESSADRSRKFDSAAYVELTSGAGMNGSPAVIIPTHQASRQLGVT
jgi:hypothetical protein